MPLMRLQKFLSAAGVCSRRRGEELIRRGRVSVNNKQIRELGSKIDPTVDQIAVDGVQVVWKKKLIYIALHKPEGYVTSCDHPGQQTVIELIDVDQRIYPVGRLDKDSTGLLLLTNDGRLHHRLSHPSFDHEKEYEVTVADPIPNNALSRMAAGLTIMGTRTRPAVVHKLSSHRFRIILREGKNRQIRRMVRKIGNRVVKLKRTRVDVIRLGRLPKGQWRYLNPNETDHLQGLLNV
jgi:23S rRNA pseudouridine2605 synthase/23S rRNA pseudouridine2604 synthase